MPLDVMKRIAARLPESWQWELKRRHYKNAIRRGQFSPDEPEDHVLDQLISPGDWVIDVGANIGHYTYRFSNLVGPGGRVLSIEPMPQTFALLAANVLELRNSNVSLLNVAASETFGEVSFDIPYLDSGLKNYYMAAIDPDGKERKVMSMPLDSLSFDRKVSLIKIDVEGHELSVFRGMDNLIKSFRPTLIIETRSEELLGYIDELDYEIERLKGSPNILAMPRDRR